MDLEAYIGAKIDEAVDAYDSSTESVKENIETIDDALVVSEERQKWKQAIEKIKAGIEKERNGLYEMKANDYTRGYNEASLDALSFIKDYTKELMK